MDIREWLQSLGLGQYEEGFRDNKIDFDVLADLTDGDLEKLGVPLGDRRRLLKAIPERGSERLPVLLDQRRCLTSRTRRRIWPNDAPSR